MSCADCTDGWIRITTRSGVDAVKSCPNCRPPRPPESGTPITEEDASAAARIITTMLSFAPDDDVSQFMIAEFILSDLCHFKEQAEWLARRAIRLHTKWSTCGLEGLRQIFCARYDRPKDGLPATLSTPAYPDGIPAERPQPAPEPVALPPAQATADEILNRDVTAAVARLPMTTARRELTPAEIRREQEFARTLEDAITYQPDRAPAPEPAKPDEKPLLMQLFQNVRLTNDEPHNEPRPPGTYIAITQADVDRELEKRKRRTDDTANA